MLKFTFAQRIGQKYFMIIVRNGQKCGSLFSDFEKCENTL